MKLILMILLTMMISSGCDFFTPTVEIKPGQKAYIAKPVKVHVFVTDKADGVRKRCIYNAQVNDLIGKEK